MFSSKKKRTTPTNTTTTTTKRVDSLIGQNTELQGDIVFNGGFHVDGKIKGNIRSHDAASMLTVSDQGSVEGEVHVPNIVLNGTIVGDVYASERIELASNARVTGNVYYKLIEMAAGAEVNGNLVHQAESERESGAAPAVKKTESAEKTSGSAAKPK